ncbi:carbonic anhydrase [Sporohalobacter salinus]|uniref:carbonic anhydrase n=1 Tax=Sporohalobacter salinus TaxID=1494606 RepID=UPI001960E083|nr:carbonic anhydrase [Sporohalobacter salinus]MBM7623389.1 carbonic anhydrase [Sporohalobacter salinus]
MNKEFLTAINCMDGRVQKPVIQWLQREYDKKYVDMITEPGPNLILAENQPKSSIESIKNRVEISVNKHGSNLIAVVGHYDCAGNPANKEEQLEHIKSAVDKVESWNLKADVIGLWVNKKWKIERVEL